MDFLSKGLSYISLAIRSFVVHESENSKSSRFCIMLQIQSTTQTLLKPLLLPPTPLALSTRRPLSTPQVLSRHFPSTSQNLPTPLSDQGFRAFPPEIRDEIYHFSLEDTWGYIFNKENKIPSLLKALRADQELYEEALAVFYKTNTFVLRQANQWSFQNMPQKLIAKISYLSMEVSLSGQENPVLHRDTQAHKYSAFVDGLWPWDDEVFRNVSALSASLQYRKVTLLLDIREAFVDCVRYGCVAHYIKHISALFCKPHVLIVATEEGGSWHGSDSFVKDMSLDFGQATLNHVSTTATTIWRWEVDFSTIYRLKRQSLTYVAPP